MTSLREDRYHDQRTGGQPQPYKFVRGPGSHTDDKPFEGSGNVSTPEKPVTILHWLWQHGEAVAFWALMFLYLLPVWAFRYVPTQDGPSHVANAQILKDYGSSHSGMEDIFQVRWELFPNWTSHLLLAALLFVAPPLVAEKLLESLYVVGFVGGFRYFVGGFGERARALSWLGFLFVYNRCFWLGFYNYCLSLALVWIIWGYCVRRRQTLGLAHVVGLMLLFVTAYFTHLVGFVLAVVGALASALLLRPRTLVRPLLVGLAALPAVLMAMDYLDHSRFVGSGTSAGLTNQPLARLFAGHLVTTYRIELAHMDRELVEHQAGSTPLLDFFLVYLCLVAAAGCADRVLPGIEKRNHAGWLFPLLLAFLLLTLYVLAPDWVGSGGFLKARLAILPPLVVLACLTEPGVPPVRYLYRAFAAVLLTVNLVLVMQTVERGNQWVAEYTAGMDAVGRGHRLIAAKANAPGRQANPLLHAGDYYCQGTDNVNLENYEAGTPFFPVKFRHGGAGGGLNNPDTIISWGNSLEPPSGGWREIFAAGRLRIYRQIKPNGQ